MSLLQLMAADLKQALKNRDELKVSSLRLMSNAIKLKAKDLLRPLEEEEEIQTMKTLAKQRREAAEMFTKGSRPDLAERERAELALIEAYLPAQLEEGQIQAILDQVFASLQPQGPQDMGKVMKEAMSRLGGKADGRLVNQLVKARF
ncbi:MAG: GatB/YqeY domain-containing protein [Desulfarculales bacterium]|jgi:uncharacterized protein YqeY|nr:GatB/YqeY domain-containing protein [Desulfarculales bacterium]